MTTGGGNVKSLVGLVAAVCGIGTVLSSCFISLYLLTYIRTVRQRVNKGITTAIVALVYATAAIIITAINITTAITVIFTTTTAICILQYTLVQVL